VAIDILGGRFRSGVFAPPVSDSGPPRTARQIWCFGVIGLTTTIAYFGLFWALRPFAAAGLANLAALLVTTLANTAANRRLTFGMHGRQRLARAHAGGLLAFGLSLIITTSSLSALALAAPRADGFEELAVLGFANALATVASFLLLRAAVQHGSASAPSSQDIRRRNAA
jgi:putative flippase GtrA